MSESLRVLREYPNKEGKLLVLAFWCPACNCEHPYRVSGEPPTWDWNGSFTKPTFNPSLLIFNRGSGSGTACHLFVRDGLIDYCSDCPHQFAGQTVEMVNFNEETRDWNYPEESRERKA